MTVADPVTERLDELAAELVAEADLDLGAPAGRRLIDSGAWQW